jgi:transcriptional regulator with XRE-family HTH domain
MCGVMPTLTQLRVQAGFDRPEDFSVFSNISVSSIYSAERGEEISLMLARRFADALGIPRSEINSIEGLKLKQPGHKPRKSSNT